MLLWFCISHNIRVRLSVRLCLGFSWEWNSISSSVRALRTCKYLLDKGFNHILLKEPDLSIHLLWVKFCSWTSFNLDLRGCLVTKFFWVVGKNFWAVRWFLCTPNFFWFLTVTHAFRCQNILVWSAAAMLACAGGTTPAGAVRPPQKFSDFFLFYI